MSTPKRNRPRKPRKLEPVHGSCRICLQPTAAHPGCVTINGTTYLLHVLASGYQLTKQDGTTYDLPTNLSSCDCQDATYNAERPGGCKHRVALRAILTALGIDEPATKPVPRLETAACI